VVFKQRLPLTNLVTGCPFIHGLSLRVTGQIAPSVGSCYNVRDVLQKWLVIHLFSIPRSLFWEDSLYGTESHDSSFHTELLLPAASAESQGEKWREGFISIFIYSIHVNCLINIE